MIWLPTFGEVVKIHDRLIEETGGSMLIRDSGLIESAIARASSGFGDYELHSTIEMKAAAIGHGLASNHGFVDGNKRVGIAAMLMILKMNAIPMRCTEEELIQLGLGIARHELQVEAVNDWIENHKMI